MTKVVDGLKVYNGLLQKQVDNQVAEMTALADSIDKVSLIERQIVPLMVRMLDSLEEFIRLDVPFLLEVGGKNREVDFLRVGRVALLYQTVGGEQTGAWNQAQGTWETLAPEQYKQDVAKGLRVARKQLAPDLLVLPIVAATGVGQ